MLFLAVQIRVYSLGVARLLAAGLGKSTQKLQKPVSDIVYHFRGRSNPRLAGQVWIVKKKHDFVRRN